MNINTKKLTTNSQKAQRINGRNCDPRIREVSTIGIANKIRSELNIARTPNLRIHCNGIKCSRRTVSYDTHVQSLGSTKDLLITNIECMLSSYHLWFLG